MIARSISFELGSLIVVDIFTATMYAMGRRLFGKNTWFSD